MMMCSNGYNILKPSSNRSLFKLIISDQTLINCNEVSPIYVHLNGQTFRGVFEQFSFTSKFWGFKCKKKNDFKKKVTVTSSNKQKRQLIRALCYGLYRRKSVTF